MLGRPQRVGCGSWALQCPLLPRWTLLRTGPGGPVPNSGHWSLCQGGGAQLPGQPSSYCTRNLMPSSLENTAPEFSIILHVCLGWALRIREASEQGCVPFIFPRHPNYVLWVLVSSVVGLPGSWPGVTSQALLGLVLEVMSWASPSLPLHRPR